MLAAHRTLFEFKQRTALDIRRRLMAARRPVSTQPGAEEPVMDADVEERHEVLIIGGGAAGLAAAAALASSGAKVAVLEGRDRLGGRIATVRRPADVPWEAGAEFVHGEAPETMAIARAAGLKVVDGEGARFWWRDGRLEQAPDFERASEEAMKAAADVARRASTDVSFADALAAAQVSEPGRSLALDYVGGFQAAEVERISARAMAMGDVGHNRTRRLTGGYDGIVRALSERLAAQSTSAVHLQCVVRAVRWSRGVVEVRASSPSDGSPSRRFRSDRAIVTLPIGILAATFAAATRTTGDEEPPRSDDHAVGALLRFDPPLEQFAGKRDAVRRLASGRAVRLVLGFREPFWQKTAGAGAAAFFLVPGAAFPTFWSEAAVDAKSLVAWAGGRGAMALEPADAPALAHRALDVLSGAFALDREALGGLLVDANMHAWSADPFSLGAYSYPVVGGAEAGRALAAPLDDTLFFAGEATCDPPSNGTVEGALASGLRAARQVLRAT
jgi:monoamine oxidase